MRGFPPIQVVLLVIAFAVLAVPLTRLTGNVQAKPAERIDIEQTGGKAVPCLLRLRYAHKPTTLNLKINGKNLISAVDNSPIEVTAIIDTPEEGVDLFLTAAWPENTPDTALTLEIEPDGLDSRSETRWSSADSLDEVITFTWK